jgi:hypothetical protein
MVYSPTDNDVGKQTRESNTVLVSFGLFGGGFHNRHMEVVRWSVLCTGRHYPHEIPLLLIYVKRLSRPQSHSAIGRIMLINNVNYTIGNRTCDLPACSSMPQPIAPHCAPLVHTLHTIYTGET